MHGVRGFGTTTARDRTECNGEVDPIVASEHVTGAAVTTAADRDGRVVAVPTGVQYTPGGANIRGIFDTVYTTRGTDAA